MAATVDPFDSFDWGEHWRRLVEGCELAGVDRARADYWDRLAPGYALAKASDDDPLFAALSAFLSPSTCVIDIGCGSGRHLVPLAARVAHLVGVEPSAAMRRSIPALPNVEIVPERWEAAVVAEADVVVASHVLNFVPDPVTFVRKMEDYARERCALQILDDSGRRPLDDLFVALTGERRPRSPRFVDAYNLLRWMGIRPHVVPLGLSAPPWWESQDDALADWRMRLAPVWDEDVARAWLDGHLQPVQGGGYSLGEGRATALAHWDPSHR